MAEVERAQDRGAGVVLGQGLGPERERGIGAAGEIDEEGGSDATEALPLVRGQREEAISTRPSAGGATKAPPARYSPARLSRYAVHGGTYPTLRKWAALARHVAASSSGTAGPAGKPSSPQGMRTQWCDRVMVGVPESPRSGPALAGPVVGVAMSVRDGQRRLSG